jgi:FtsZ-binding cell division protein ZapB
LNDELKLLSDKNAKVQQEVADLKGAKEGLSKENADLKKNINAIQEEVTTLKREKSDLLRELEELKKRGGESAEPGKAPGPGATETTARPTAKEQVSKPQEQANPCDALVEFMKKNGEIVRQHKGEERARLIAQVKQDYAARLLGAPERAIKAAEAWISELITNWDKPTDDMVFNLLTKRNAALEACKKSPEEAGF